MKNVLLLSLGFILALGIGSCEVDKKCNCGIVTDDGIDTDPNTFDLYYWVEIKNDCSGNIKKFYLNENDWYDAIVGDPYCITNVTSWRLDNVDLVESQINVEEVKYSGR